MELKYKKNNMEHPIQDIRYPILNCLYLGFLISYSNIFVAWIPFKRNMSLPSSIFVAKEKLGKDCGASFQDTLKTSWLNRTLTLTSKAEK